MEEAHFSFDAGFAESGYKPGLLEPLASDFSPAEVQLPYLQWDEIQRTRRASLGGDVRTWLDKWNQWDFANSPMDDEKRRLIRLGHYLGWLHSADR